MAGRTILTENSQWKGREKGKKNGEFSMAKVQRGAEQEREAKATSSRPC